MEFLPDENRMVWDDAGAVTREPMRGLENAVNSLQKVFKDQYTKAQSAFNVQAQLIMHDMLTTLTAYLDVEDGVLVVKIYSGGLEMSHPYAFSEIADDMEPEVIAALKEFAAAL